MPKRIDIKVSFLIEDDLEQVSLHTLIDETINGGAIIGPVHRSVSVLTVDEANEQSLDFGSDGTFFCK